MTPQEKRKELLGATLVKNLERRHFEAYYCPTAAEAVEKAISLIPEGSSISWGGSMTIRDMGLTKAVKEKNYHVIDRDTAANPAEMREMHRQGLLVDYYLTSTNAISEDGILVNIDGTGNRVASTIYGHKKVYFVVGKNKMAPDYDSALWRARNIASPMNAKRLNRKTPCAVSGHCHNCNSPDRICCSLNVLWFKPLYSEYEVVLIEEDMGY